MTIETKFNIGDCVHFISNDRPRFGEIKHLRLEIGYGICIIEECYTISVSGDDIEATFNNIDSDKVFKTKEELIKSLFTSTRYLNH